MRFMAWRRRLAPTRSMRALHHTATGRRTSGRASASARKNRRLGRLRTQRAVAAIADKPRRRFLAFKITDPTSYLFVAPMSASMFASGSCGVPRSRRAGFNEPTTRIRAGLGDRTLGTRRRGLPAFGAVFQASFELTFAAGQGPAAHSGSRRCRSIPA